MKTNLNFLTEKQSKTSNRYCDYLVENLKMCKLSSPINSPGKSIKSPDSEEQFSEMKETIYDNKFVPISPQNLSNVFIYNIRN